MKLKLLLLVLIIWSSNLFAQSKDSLVDQNTIVVQEFEPDRSLLDTFRWTRVTPNRYECSFLRLAVELKDFKYFLIEMDGNKRVLISSESYSIIRQAIMKLTLRTSPNLSVFSSTDSS